MTRAARKRVAHRVTPLLVLLLVSLLAAACAVRLGGGGPREFEVIAFRAEAAADPTQVAALIGGGSDIVLLSADADSAWFASVASAAGLGLSGPGTSGPIGLAFLTDLEIVGDTSLVLDVPGGGVVHLQDALYRLDGSRYIDLMAARVDAPDLRAAVRRLLDYIAYDVMAHVPVLLAVDGATPQAADSVATLMRAYYSSDVDCRETAIVAGTAQPVRLLYGPSARITCRSSRPVPRAAAGAADGAGAAGSAARVVTGR
jgi:hypothetical protein